MGGKRFPLGLVAALAGSSAFGQFAGDRPGAPPTRPAAPQAAYLTHPLGVKPEHGAYMICVKSYTGPQSQKLAEALAEYVRTTHHAAAYLFEYGGEQRAVEEARLARARVEQTAANAPFLRTQEDEKRKAEAEGRAFLDQPPKIKLSKVTLPEQWAVLVGGFPTDEAARRALDVVRKWPPPAEQFMDQQFSVGTDQSAGTYINPFATAMAVPSPAAKKHTGPPPVDPALIKLNSEEPLSLLKTTKAVTLLVKPFGVRTKARSKDEEPGVFDRLLGRTGDDPGALLEATAKQARELATALRTPGMHKAAQEAANNIAKAAGQPPFKVPPLTAYVLHTRTGSLVTVGEFTSEDDPDLIAAGRILQYMEFEIKYPDGRTERKRMFDNVIPMPIPRPQ